LFSALHRTQKSEQIYVGGSDVYEPMCRKHYLENEIKLVSS
jgi:thymidine kinase